MKTIDLIESHRGKDSTTFTGRPQGKEIRKILKLDVEDKDISKVTITIPIGTTSINPSFYLGLFFDSIKKLGGMAGFKEKYEINFLDENEIIVANLRSNLQECERQAQNEFDGKTGLDY